MGIEIVLTIRNGVQSSLYFRIGSKAAVLPNPRHVCFARYLGKSASVLLASASVCFHPANVTASFHSLASGGVRASFLLDGFGMPTDTTLYHPRSLATLKPPF